MKNGCSAIYYNAGVIISAFVFLIADKDTLELGKVFSTLALLGYIFNFSILYSNYAIESLYALSVFNKRVEQVITGPLLLKEKTQINRKKFADGEPEASLVQFVNVSASWKPLSETSGELFTGEEIESDEDSSVLRKVNFKLSWGEKVAVIGTVGSGKTSLLMAILGEMPIEQGIVYSRESQDIVLAEQEPLIVTGTVESNILFGLKKDKRWYEEVCWACCLDEDFSAMPSGDQTKLGEMGHNLSGGQKSRISLARAVYRKTASMILIDGTLSSLDAKIAKLVMERAVLGLSADKCVVLVTHDLDHAAQMDSVIYLKGSLKKPKIMS